MAEQTKKAMKDGLPDIQRDAAWLACYTAAITGQLASNAQAKDSAESVAQSAEAIADAAIAVMDARRRTAGRL